MGNSDKVNSFNLYKCISEAHSSTILLSDLADRIKPIRKDELAKNAKVDNIEKYEIDKKDGSKVYSYYLYYFEKNKFYIE